MKSLLVMNKMLLLLLLFTCFSFVKADDCFPPAQAKLVYEYNTSELLKGEISILNERLISFAEKTSNQFVVVFVNDLCGYAPVEYATKLGHDWGVGKSKEDNGLVILVKPKRGNSKGEVFISVGYGLEGAIPDGTTKEIIEYEMIPLFKSNDYYGAVVAALNVLEPLAQGEFNKADYSARVKARQKGKDTGFLFMIVIFIIFFFVSRIGQAKKYASTNNTSFWTAMMAASLMSGGGRGYGGSSSYGNFSSGSGGFGGFGGGGFGGGGAGGSW